MATPHSSGIEPPASAWPYSTTANGRHYIWRGWGQGKNATTIGEYDPHTEKWSLRPTTGPTPPGVWYGGCTAVGGKLYTFGGYGSGILCNDLYQLDLGSEPYKWTKVELNDLSQWPVPKCGCGLVSVGEGSLLGCFGGWGDNGVTNEFHLFNLQQGVWSSPDLKGQRHPPCAFFSFTKIDRHRAVLFGGSQHGGVRLNDLYLFDFRNMEVTKVEPVQGEPWPVGREDHAACCLNYSEDHPTVLVSGGLDNDNKTLGDMWILDVDGGKWTEVTPPESVKPRYGHSLTATSLGPELTEVLMFGGQLKGGGVPIAETTILRFESLFSESTAPSPSVAGPSTGKWVLVDVAENNTRGSERRLRDKIAKIIEANHRASSAREPTDQSLRDRVRSLEQQLQAAEERARDAERRAAEASHREQATQHRLQKSQRLVEEANHRCQDAERRIQELTAENGQLQADLQEMERRQQATQCELEGKTRELAAHNTEVWRIPANSVNTVRTIGSGGWGEVLEGTVRVAMKRMYRQILNQHNLEKLQREIKLLTEVQHPNLVQFIGAVYYGGNQSPLIVTELLDINLRQAYEQSHLRRGNRLSIFMDIARALDYLHQRCEPIIHRDVSAPNVLLQRMPNNQWKGKVSDLGSANFLQDARTMGEGAIVYSPPEVIPQPVALAGNRERPPQTVKIDVYSYGIVMCEVTASRFPSEENFIAMITQVQREQPRLHGLILACTKRDPSDRLSMAEVFVELGKLAPF